ncbi:universal stress protein, partial [Arthrospira platensis SPKY2]
MHRFNNIVYIVSNNTNENSPSLIHAVNLANANQADLTILKILPNMSAVKLSKLTGVDEKEVKEKIVSQQNAKLQHLVTSMEVDLNAKSELRVGKRYIEIIRAVKANDFDLVIKEVDDVDWINRFLGSDDM